MMNKRKGVTRERIRQLLQENPWLTRTDLARLVGVTPQVVGDHLRELRRAGQIPPKPVYPLSVQAAREYVIRAALEWKERRDNRVAYGLRDMDLDRAVTRLIQAMRYEGWQHSQGQQSQEQKEARAS